VVILKCTRHRLFDCKEGAGGTVQFSCLATHTPRTACASYLFFQFFKFFEKEGKKEEEKKKERQEGLVVRHTHIHMGSGNSRPQFEERIKIIAEGNPPRSPEFWVSLWITPIEVSDIWELLTPDVIRKMRRNKPKNLQMLLLQVSENGCV
jgi:hypothetical protein